MVNIDPSQKSILGIDIGGTKINAQLFSVINGRIAENALWKEEQPTKKGKDAHAQQVASLIAAANSEAALRNASLVAVGIGSPGRFNETGAIKPGTNTNLENTPGEMDNVVLVDTYRQVIAQQMGASKLKNVPIFVQNDGSAMLAGLLDAIHSKREGTDGKVVDQHGKLLRPTELAGKHVALFGIGTGIGHAIAKVQKDGSFDFVTDGHASKLRLKIDESDWPMIEKMKQNAGQDAVITFDDHTARAEDLFRGPMVNAMAGVEDGRDIHLDNPDHVAALRFAGKYMARTVALIKSGQSQDTVPANGWSERDKAEAAKTSIYLISGGMGNSPLGKEMIRYAKDELNALGISDVRLVQMTELGM